MKFKFSMFDKPIVFDKSSGIAKKIISQKSGSVFVTSSKPNDPTLKITAFKKPKSKFAGEQVIQIPLHNMSWEKIGDHLFIIPDGPHGTPPTPSEIGKDSPPPKTQTVQLISIGGLRPNKTRDALKIKLAAVDGNWHVEPDLAAEVLNIHFKGLEKS
jgi:hypothetical protein